MTAYSIRVVAALSSVLITLTIFQGVASLAGAHHPAAHEQVFAAQTPAPAGSETTAPQY